MTFQGFSYRPLAYMDFLLLLLFRTYTAWTQDRRQLWDVYMVNLLTLLVEIVDVILTPHI